MKRLFSFLLAAAVLIMCVLPAAAATASEAAPSGVHDENFNVELATVLISVICAVLFVAVVVICIVLAKRNIHN